MKKQFINTSTLFAFDNRKAIQAAFKEWYMSIPVGDIYRIRADIMEQTGIDRNRLNNWVNKRATPGFLEREKLCQIAGKNIFENIPETATEKEIEPSTNN